MSVQRSAYVLRICHLANRACGSLLMRLAQLLRKVSL